MSDKNFMHQLVWTLVAGLLVYLPYLVPLLAPTQAWSTALAGTIIGAVWVPRPQEIAAKRRERASGQGQPPPPRSN